MRFSDLQRALQPFMPAILEHPFNHALRTGALPRPAFNRFLCDDKHYLNHFSRALTHIATRLTSTAPSDAEHFYRFAHRIKASEMNLHRKHLKQDHTPTLFKPHNSIQNQAVLGYIQHLHQSTRSQPLPAAMAALLPCYYLYAELGKTMPHDANHPYHGWISTYTSPQFTEVGNTIITLFEKHADDGHDALIKTSFLTSVQHEIHFWDSCVSELPHPLPLRWSIK